MATFENPISRFPVEAGISFCVVFYVVFHYRLPGSGLSRVRIGHGIDAAVRAPVGAD
jgi:hypothetical protein